MKGDLVDAIVTPENVRSALRLALRPRVRSYIRRKTIFEVKKRTSSI